MIYKGAILLLLSVCVVLLFNINKRVGEYPTPVEDAEYTKNVLEQFGVIPTQNDGNIIHLIKQMSDNRTK